MANQIGASARLEAAALALVCVASLALGIGCRHGGAHGPDSSQPEKWKMKKFMISHWGSPKDEKSIKLFLEDGINTVIAVPEEVPFCRKHGLKVLLATDPKGAAPFVGDPIVWGYFITDEPARKKIPYETLVPRFQEHHKLDPIKPAYINLNELDDPDKYIEMFKPRVLSYDYYQWWSKREPFFSHLERFRRAALKADIPLICWVEAVCVFWTPNIPVDNEAKLRLSVFSSLAYGVKGIQWWAWKSHIRDAGTINAELKKMGPTLLKLTSVDVFHTPPAPPKDAPKGHVEPLPKGTQAIPRDYWVQSPTKDLVIGLLKKKGKAKKDFAIVVNRSIKHGITAVLKFGKPVTAVTGFNKRKGKWEKLGLRKAKNGKQELHYYLPAGDGALLKIKRP